MTNLADFVGNPNVYAVQLPGGGYRPERHPLTRELLDKHEAGGVTLGTYVLNYDKARFFVFDIDERDLTLARELASRCIAHGFNPFVEFSGRKGYHVWVLFDQWHLGTEVMQLAQSIAHEVGFQGEVFPKQGVARDLGNLIKLPLGKHAVTGNDSKFIVTGSIASAMDFASALAAMPPVPVYTPSSTGAYPCLDFIQSDPPREGERNNAFFHFACMLRRAGYDEGIVRAALEALNDRGSGLTDQELDSIAERSEFSGPICSQLPPNKQCGEACLNNKARKLSVRPGQLRHAIEGEMVVMTAGPHNSANVIDLEHPDVDLARANLKPTDGRP